MDYTLKVLEKFNIKKYHFVTNMYGQSALIIDIGLNSYRIDIEDYLCEMVIMKKIIVRKAQRHPKEYWVEIKRFKTDCIYCSIREVKNDSIGL
jgi:hypothetical protein